MTALQTERFYPNLTTRHPHLNHAAAHAWTAILAATCTTCALGTGLAAAGTLAFLVNPLTTGPAWQVMFAAVLGTATWRLARYTAALVRIIRGRL